MRLLNVHTGLLEEYFDTGATPKYAILSHTWAEEEVTFQDLESEDYKSKIGYRKIEGCCRQAIKDGYDYVWVDTCCIDKKSLTELSEAINSMYQWYSMSAVCYVYLADIETDEAGKVDNLLLKESRWFFRGWTLQELLAPNNLVFFDRRWSVFGFTGENLNHHDVPDLTSILPAMARIDIRIFRGASRFTHLNKATAAEKFSWAAHRQTTRKEDMAYCLLGILGVNMPLLYGEGDRAFIRLQQEYIRQYNDPTLLLWGFDLPCQDLFWRSRAEWALAPLISLFSNFSSPPIFERNSAPFTFLWTNNGVEIELLLLDIDDKTKLACFGGHVDFLSRYREFSQQTSSSLLSSLQRVRKKRETSSYLDAIALPLLHSPANSMLDFDVYERAILWPPFLIPENLCWNAKWTRVFIKGLNIRSLIPSSTDIPGMHREYDINIKNLSNAGFSLNAVYPPTNTLSQPTRVIQQVKAVGIQRTVLIFKGPRNISLVLFTEYEFVHLKLSKLSVSIGEMTMLDVLNHLLSRGEALSERARGKVLAKLGRSLSGALDPNASSFEVPGRRLGTPGLDATVSAVVRSGFANANFRSIVLQWEQH